MRNAYMAVFGAEDSKRRGDLIEQHGIAYDNDPETWEKMRREAAEIADPDTRTLAEGIAAAERLNKGIFEDGGRRLEFTKAPDGSTQLIQKQIWSDEDIQKKKNEDGEAIVSGIGKGLLRRSSQEAQKLVEFLSEVYFTNTGEKPDASAIGRTWLALIEMRDEDPDSKLAQQFESLNDAHFATLPPDGEWSENPGCFEGHLKRKQNNPLFPKTEREVTQEQIDEARERDQEDAAKLKQEVVDLASDIEKLPELATVNDFAPIRETIDDLLYKGAGIGAVANDTRDLLNAIRETLIDSMRAGGSGNEKALRALAEAEEYHHSGIEIVHDPFIAQLSRIPSSDVIPAMLSELPETIRKTMAIIEQDKKETVFKEACLLMKSAQAEGEIIPLADEKLRAIRGE